MERAGRHLAVAALVCLLPLLAGCRFQMSQKVDYTRDGKEYPPPGADTAPVRAPKKNDLVLGVRKFTLSPSSPEDPEREAGDAKDIGKDFVESLLDAKIFKEVHYPLREEPIDVEIEPIITLDLNKNKGTNFVKILPGIVFPWIDGYGFDYDHRIAVELRVRDPKHPERICDTYRAESTLSAERYPSVFWFVGIHATLIALAIMETAGTDTAVCQLLAERDAQALTRGALQWLMKEFSPTERACPSHPEIKSGKFCSICRASLRYPILNKRDGVLQAAAPQAPTATARPK